MTYSEMGYKCLKKELPSKLSEIREFEERNRIGDKISITKQSIKTIKDYEVSKALLFVISLISPKTDLEIKVGEHVEIEVEDVWLEFDEYSYIQKED